VTYAPRRSFLLFPEAAWAEARRCFPVIQRLANTPRRTEAQVPAAAAELGYSRTQVYERLGRFIADPRLTSLLPRRRGPIPGGSRLSGELNQLIDEAIESLYLTRQRPRLFDLVTRRRRSRRNDSEMNSLANVYAANYRDAAGAFSLNYSACRLSHFEIL
jgi:hypothetical protein